MSSLGLDAYAGTIHSQTIDNKGSLTNGANIGMSKGHRLRVYEITTPPTNTYTSANNGQATAKRGLHLVDSPVAFSMTLPVGEFDGDTLEFLHIAGGNTATFTGNLRSPATQFQFSATAGGYVKLIWHSSVWFIVARSSDSLAGGTAVANLPVIG